ncbi:uncharacterized protein LOC112589255 [Harpegnathos saltator]|uniref:uncharacterized protein LOC112589255 n=1 Tax=Harpegnathos saltator TaxID=610380 RepID=UPI000DBEEA80|nr:uncharacterized protein LOC112589255 [Harpegnathos saltator]
MDAWKRFVRSTMPFAHGDATATLRCLIRCSSINSLNSVDVKAVPRSLTTSIGFPNVQKIERSRSITSFDPVDRVGKSHVNLVNASTTTKICLLPCFVDANGPKWSMCRTSIGFRDIVSTCSSPSLLRVSHLIMIDPNHIYRHRLWHHEF